MNHLYNKKGYTLTYAMVVIGLLLILTGSVTFVSYYNIKTSRISGHVNTSFYANDGAMEEALTELSVSTYNAEVAAWNRVTNPSLLGESQWMLFLDAIYEDVNNDVFSIDVANEIIARALQGEFETTFYNYLYQGTHVTHPFFDTSQVGNSRYLDFNGYRDLIIGSPSEINSSIVYVMEDVDIINDSTKQLTGIVSADADPVITVSDILVNEDESFSFNVKSNGEYHKYDKEITVDITIIVPKYTFSVAMLQESIAISRNLSTDQAILSNGDIVFAEGTTTVTGDIYAYGDSIDIKYNQNRNSYGGIVVGYESVAPNVYNSAVLENDLGKGNTKGTLDITGNIATRNSIKLETDESSITVNMLPASASDRKGNIFANAVHIREEASDTELTVHNDLYMYADLFIAGDDATITIGSNAPPIKTGSRDDYRPTLGGIYGLHSANFAALTEYTRTGTIMVSTKALNPSITANGVYLYGVMRYNAYDKDLFDSSSDNEKAAYQSGESLTTYKNSQYYQSLLSSDIYQKGVFASLQTFVDAQATGTLYDLITFGIPGYTLDQVSYRSNHFYTMGYYASTDTQNIYKPISDDDKGIVTIRNAEKDGVNGYYGVATTGILAFNGKVVNNTQTKITNALDNLSGSILGTEENVDEKVSLLGFTKKINADDYGEIPLWDEWFNSSNNPDVVINEESSEVAFYNSDENVDVFINMVGPNDSINILGLERLTESFSGTLVSEGDIYINADLGETVTFTGNIISKKNIYFIGRGTKNIVYNEPEIYKAIHGSPELKSFYNISDVDGALDGRKLTRSATSKLSSFDINIVPNNAEIDKIRLNYVSDAQTDGTNITDSNSIIINSWRETN
jgi:hypothetical protein